MNRNIKLTKIVATIGPASEDEATIISLIKAGVDIFRFNLKHNSLAWHKSRIRRVKKQAKLLGKRVGILVDLQGPEIRLVLNEKITVFEKGEAIPFSFTRPQVINNLQDGQRLLVDDGKFAFRVITKKGKKYLSPLADGELLNRKTVSIPGVSLDLPVLTSHDLEGIKMVAAEKVDFVALSFVRTVNDLKFLRKTLARYSLPAKIVTKIETKRAIENLEEIMDETDVAMVARGDLGVELPPEEVPFWQRIILKKGIEKAKPVIIATHMLQSMIDSPRPTRAEISDVAEATYELTDATMLSGETALGHYPQQAVKIMARTLFYNESKFSGDKRHLFRIRTVTMEEIICDSAFDLYLSLKKNETNLRAIVAFTETGKTARLVSRYRPLIPIYAFTSNQRIANSLIINFGVFPFIQEEVARNSRVSDFTTRKALKFLVKNKYLEKGDRVIILHGDYWQVEGGTSTLKVVRI